jgi:hypothetical protein
MSPTQLKMQPTIHLQSLRGYCPRPFPGLFWKCIVGCIFNCVGLIITREIPSIQGVSAKTFEPNISVICQRTFMKFKIQIF